MDFLLFLAYSLLPVIAHVNDPAYDFTRDAAERRRYSCERLPQESAHRLFPGRVPEPAPRGVVWIQSDALHCEPRVLDVDVRSPRDEAILSTLTERVGSIAAAVASTAPPSTRWTVDAFYPNPRVALKVAAAARTALAEKGASVGNGVPVLAAGDLLVLRTLRASRAFPLACQRLVAEGSLAEDEAFLAIFLLDSRETQLHAGTCRNGRWEWIP